MYNNTYKGHNKALEKIKQNIYGHNTYLKKTTK